MPVSVQLSGTASDDGLPNPPGELSHMWSQVSGPSMVEWSDKTALDTTVTINAPGTYVLRLLANDGELPGEDTLTVVVKPAMVVNQPPEVDAGPEQEVQMP